MPEIVTNQQKTNDIMRIYREREVRNVADDKRIQAEHDYMLGMAYKDIAAKYDVTINTVKSWKKRYGWERQKSVHTKMHTKMQKGCTPKEDEKEAEKEPENDKDDLSTKQELFCVYYVKYRSQVKAYQKAYGGTYENACAHAYKVWKKVEVQKRIEELTSNIRENVRVELSDLIKQQMDIAHADIRDFVTITPAAISFNTNMDGALVKKIKIGREGPSIELYDKQKAIEYLTRHVTTDDKSSDNVRTLAEIVLNSRPNRKLQDFEEKKGDEE